MTDYKKLLDGLFEKYDEELASALDGNIEQYCYKELYKKESGTSDANYNNRLRISYTILYIKKYEDYFGIEWLIVRLFNEEIIDRETNSFQGIGKCLEVLTELLKKYDVPDKELLFEQAKNANFDCMCGFDYTCGCNSEYTTPLIEEYTIEQAIELLISLNEKELAKKLLAEYTYSDDVYDYNKIYFCMKGFKSIGDFENELYCARTLLNMSVLTDDNLEICNRMLELIKLYNSYEQYDEASGILDMLIPRLHSIDNWYSTGLGKNSLEQCMLIILNCDSLAEDLWDWAEPFLKRIIDNMYGNLYKMASLAAYKMADFTFSELLSDKYDELHMIF